MLHEYIKALIVEQDASQKSQIQNLQAIKDTNAVLQSIQHKFSDSLTFPPTPENGPGIALDRAEAPEHQRFWNKYDSDIEFKVLVDKSTLHTKGAIHGRKCVWVLSAALFFEFWHEHFKRSLSKDDVLIRNGHSSKYSKLSAEALKACAEIAANIEQFIWLIEDNAEEIQT